MFYMIDGFRYGFSGISDVAPGVSLAVVGIAFALVTGLLAGAAQDAATNSGTEHAMMHPWFTIKTCLSAGLPCEHLTGRRRWPPLSRR